jgi:hypothetical protein
MRVSFLCTGEKYSDIMPFDPRRYACEFTGIEWKAGQTPSVGKAGSGNYA